MLYSIKGPWVSHNLEQVSCYVPLVPLVGGKNQNVQLIL
jgi:hypothetical protein